MDSNTKNPPMIDKELVSDLRFPNEEVLLVADDIKVRKANLEKALKLGNIEKGKITIIFEDSEGIKQVETTIWGLTDNRIILKQGVVIPIQRIHEIKI